MLNDYEIDEKIKKLEEQKEILDLLQKLYFHHDSQSKPNTSKCSSEYHRKIANKIGNILWD